jgi:hypothetical protein
MNESGKKIVIVLIVCSLLVLSNGTLFARNFLQNSNPEPVPSKKKHGWLIPVGIAAGFGIGLLAGFSAFDEAINSDQKIWTTAILSAAAGGFAGWAVAHHLDKPSSTFRLNPIGAPSSSMEFSANPQCFQKRDMSLKQQSNCMIPCTVCRDDSSRHSFGIISSSD